MAVAVLALWTSVRHSKAWGLWSGGVRGRMAKGKEQGGKREEQGQGGNFGLRIGLTSDFHLAEYDRVRW
jgi:hypothetical protein